MSQVDSLFGPKPRRNESRFERRMTDHIEPWMAAKVLLDRLARGLPVAALGVRSSRTADVARIARSTGHQAIWIDMEHSTIPVDTAAMICAASVDLGLVPFVRPPEQDYGVIGRLLDGGAMGIIAPRIETAEQARELVAACKFPPLGHRSAIGTLPLVEFRAIPVGDFNGLMNTATIVKVLIESPLGVANIRSIAAVPGVDLIGIGTNDLTAEMGIPGEYRNSDVRHAHEVALAACRDLGKPLVIGGIADPAYAAELIRMGAAPFLFTGIDTELLLDAARDRIRQALASINA
jgi:4-hydroxy-2-oxoheptanedioate aldolase